MSELLRCISKMQLQSTPWAPNMLPLICQYAAPWLHAGLGFVWFWRLKADLRLLRWQWEDLSFVGLVVLMVSLLRRLLVSAVVNCELKTRQQRPSSAVGVSIAGRMQSSESKETTFEMTETAPSCVYRADHCLCVLSLGLGCAQVCLLLHFFIYREFFAILQVLTACFLPMLLVTHRALVSVRARRQAFNKAEATSKAN